MYEMQGIQFWYRYFSEMAQSTPFEDWIFKNFMGKVPQTTYHVITCHFGQHRHEIRQGDDKLSVTQTLLGRLRTLMKRMHVGQCIQSMIDAL